MMGRIASTNAGYALRGTCRSVRRMTVLPSQPSSLFASSRLVISVPSAVRPGLRSHVESATDAVADHKHIVSTEQGSGFAGPEVGHGTRGDDAPHVAPGRREVAALDRNVVEGADTAAGTAISQQAFQHRARVRHDEQHIRLPARCQLPVHQRRGHVVPHRVTGADRGGYRALDDRIVKEDLIGRADLVCIPALLDQAGDLARCTPPIYPHDPHIRARFDPAKRELSHDPAEPSSFGDVTDCSDPHSTPPSSVLMVSASAAGS